MDELLTVADVAERLKVSKQTVYNWIDRGLLQATRAGPRRVRIGASDLEAFLAAGRPRVPSATDGDLRAELTVALGNVQQRLDGPASPEFAVALRSLARAATRNAAAIDRYQADRGDHQDHEKPTSGQRELA